MGGSDGGGVSKSQLYLIPHLFRLICLSPVCVCVCVCVCVSVSVSVFVCKVYTWQMNIKFA